MKTYDSDVVVVGGGIAGLICAHECLEKGLSVNVVDRDCEENLGGLAKLAFGGMALVDTPLQRKIGIKDSPEIALQDWLSFANFNDDDIWPRKWAQYYVNNSSERVYEWLVRHGLRFFPAVNWVERGMNGDGNSLPRYHVIWGTGHRLVEIFVDKLKAHKNSDLLRFIFNVRVESFDNDGDSVRGCTGIHEQSAEKVTFSARNTVVACGGITGSLEKVRKNWHQPWGEAPAEMLNGSHKFADGILHDALSDQGATVTHLDKMWNYAAGIPHPEPEFENHGLSLIPCKSALWLDASGKRIGPTPLVTGFDTNELCRRVSQQKEPYTWQVLNWRIAAREFAISGSEHNPSIRDRKLFTFVKEVLLGNHKLIKQMAEQSDHFIVADTVDQLVKKMNQLDNNNLVKVEDLRLEIESYDAMIRRGKTLWNDDQLRRIDQARNWRSDKVRTCSPKPILDNSSGPLIAMKLRLITRKSLGGIQTNLKSQVLDRNECVIKGLYAVGEAAGFGGGGASGFKSLEGTFISGCVLTARAAAESIK